MNQVWARIRTYNRNDSDFKESPIIKFKMYWKTETTTKKMDGRKWISLGTWIIIYFSIDKKEEKAMNAKKKLGILT